MAVGSAPRDLLRFITCGSVDDGKSTLIGRLLHDAGAIPDDQLSALKTSGGNIEFAHLLDGLTLEREQGITVDVAYCYFSTARRTFIAADAPGHEQYTRNMVTGASTAALAVILMDARKGVLTQTRRHSQIVSLLGVRTVILAVTKMDLVGWSPEIFEALAADYRALAESIGIKSTVAIPVSGLTGENVVKPVGDTAPWYTGPTLLAALEDADPAPPSQRDGPFRLPVQGVIRSGPDFRGYTGQIVSGTVRPGDSLRVTRAGLCATVREIVTSNGPLAEANTGQSVTLTLDGDIDLGRGDILTDADQPLPMADQFEVTLVWMAEEPLLPGRLYDLKLGTQTALAQVTDIRHRIAVDTQEKLAARTLALNDIGVCHLSVSPEVAFAPYTENRTLGGFILIDRQSGSTLAAGMIRFALRRAQNIIRQPLRVSRRDRSAIKNQKPAVVWLTGLSGAGKSTIANAVESLLHAEGRHTYLIDGDNLRHGLSRDLGFSDADRVENVRRAAETAKLMADAGLIILVALISPFAAEREMARDMMEPDEFIEVFVDATLATVEQRDSKGLYARARRGDLPNFTGIDSPYDVPANPEVHIQVESTSPDEAAHRIIDHLRTTGRLTG